MKIYWQGTDVLLYRSFMPYMGWRWKLKIVIMRRTVWFMDRAGLVSGHYYDSENLLDEIQKFFKQPGEIKPDPVKYPKPFEKKEHMTFNVLYYDPSGSKRNRKSIRWLYGIDIIEAYMKKYADVNWIKVDGRQDMSEVYPLIDLYFRPTRHDGASRMVQECVINNIEVLRLSDIQYGPEKFHSAYRRYKTKLGSDENATKFGGTVIQSEERKSKARY